MYNECERWNGNMLNWVLDVWLLFTLSHARLFVTPWTAAHQVSLSFTISRSLLKLMSIDIQPSHPLLSLLTEDNVLAFNISQHQGLFQWVHFLNQVLDSIWSWSFKFSISPSDEYSGLNSFRIEWFDLLDVQGTSRVFSNTTVQKYQLFSAQLSLQSYSHIHTWQLEKQ